MSRKEDAKNAKVNYSIKILKAELKSWKYDLRDQKEYYNGEEKDPYFVKYLRVCKNKIGDLSQAIEILEKAKHDKRRTQ